VWVEENIEETFTFYKLPREHHKHLNGTNMLERINEEFKRSTLLFASSPSEESALRRIRALAVEIHEDWIEAHPLPEYGKCCANKEYNLNLLEAA
jgi:putative transposase